MLDLLLMLGWGYAVFWLPIEFNKEIIKNCDTTGKAKIDTSVFSDEKVLVECKVLRIER